MNPRTIAWVMAAAVVVYLVLLGNLGVRLVLTGEPAGVGLGLAVLVFPFIGAWVVWRELQFGYRLQAMARSWEAAGGVPDGIRFETARQAATDRPDDWRSWFELGLAYDADGDRKRARGAMRHASGLFPG